MRLVPELGAASLVAALLLAAGGVAAGVRASRTLEPAWLESARRAAAAHFALVTLAVLALEYLLVTTDFGVRYVVQVTTSASPVRYRIAGLWGALEGSILLWEWLQALCVLLVARRAAALRRELSGYALAVLFVVSGVFLLMMVAIASPFQRLPSAAPDGRGLNPLLEVTDMLVHPLLLYAGYVGFVVPFAFAMAALLAGRLDATWLTVTRRWTLLAWTFLTAGILYGGFWSYRTLGWGGYWAWDPVENASFMPWLTGTAFVHSVMVQERRPMLKVWNLALVTLTFALTIFGTFLTRSGVIGSVHAFASGAIGPFLLAYLAVILVVALGLLAWRWEQLGDRAELDALLSRESVFLLNNLLLVAFCFTVFVGTIFPLLSEAVTGAKVSVGTPYFDWVSVPILLLTLLLMGAGPLVPWRRGSWPVLGRLLRGPALVAAAATALTWAVFRLPPALVLLGYALPYFVAAAILGELWRATRGRRRATGETPLLALGRLLAQNHRRYGGLIVHLGVVLVAIGVATSSAGKVEREAQLQRGESLEVGRYRLRFLGFEVTEQATHVLVTAGVEVHEAGRRLTLLRPGQRIYQTASTPFASVAVDHGLARDLYVILGGFDRGGQWALVKGQIHPMITWIWLGGAVIVAGGLLALWPAGRAAPVTVPAGARLPIAGGAGPRDRPRG